MTLLSTPELIQTYLQPDQHPLGAIYEKFYAETALIKMRHSASTIVMIFWLLGF